MTRLPDQPPTAPQAGQPTHLDQQQIDRIAEAFNTALEQATAPPLRYDNPNLPSHKDGSRIGTTPPVTQPGIPPQSQAAVDYAVRVLATAVATALISGSAALIMAASRFADPLVCGIVFGAPIGLAIPIAALSSLARRAKEAVQAAPPTINQHYSGPITQTNTTVNADSHGLIAITRPELPPATRRTP